MEQPNVLAVALGLRAMRPAASENEHTMRSTHGSSGAFLKRARMRSTRRSTGRRIRRTSAGRLRPSTSTPTMADTSAITKRPSRNHSGREPHGERQDGRTRRA